MALRELLAELDVKVKNKEDVSKTNTAIDAFVRAVDNAKTPLQTYSRNVQRMAASTKSTATPLQVIGDLIGKVFGGTAQSAFRGLTSATGGSALALGGWATAALAAKAIAERLVTLALDLAHAYAEMTAEIIHLSDQLDDQAHRTGQSISEIQQWNYVAERMGVESGDLNAGMRAFNRTLGQAALGSSGARGAFAALHVAIRDGNGQLRNRGEVMRDAIHALQQIQNPTLRAAHAQQIFGRGSEGLGGILNATGAELDAQIARYNELGGGLSDNVIERGAAADDALKDLQLTFLALKSALVSAVLPGLTRIVDALAPLVGKLADLIENSSAVETIFGVVAIAAIALAAALTPLVLGVGLVIAPFVGLFLIVEDVVTAFRGGDSIVGRFVQRMTGLMGAAMNLRQTLDAMVVAWMEVKAAALDAFASMIEGAARALSAIGADIPEGLRNAVVGSRIAAASAGAQAGVGREILSRGIIANQARTSTSASQTNAVKIEVHGGGDPNIAAERTARTVDRVLRQRTNEAARIILPQAAGA